MSISASDVRALCPFLVFSIGGLLVLLLDALYRRERPLPWSAMSAAIALLAGIVALARGNAGPGVAFGVMVREDAFAAIIVVIIALSTLLAIVLSGNYLKKMGRERGDYYALLLFSASGMTLFVSSTELLTLFLGLELLSIPVYILSGFLRHDPKSCEASLKYFLLGAFSSAIFLFGGALIYAATGLTDLSAAFGRPGGGLLLHVGTLLLLTGFLFKVAAVPFHMWTPDVYEGAPTAVTAFMAAAVKAAAFGAFARILFLLQPATAAGGLSHYLWWIAVLTMCVGNLAALTQNNIKRMLAYSSIAHAGYMLIGLAVFAATGDGEALSGILYYLLAYALMNTGAFAVVILWGETWEKGGERLEIGDWAGWGWKSPATALALSVFMISLSGIPPTAGFFGKYTIFRNALEHGFTSLVVIAVLNSALSVYYYLRVLVALYMKPSECADAPSLPPARVLATVVAFCALATLWLGFAPDGILPGVPALLGVLKGSVLTLR